MELSRKQIESRELKYISIKQFIEEFHPGISPEAVDYNMRNNKIDYYRPGNERFVVLTPKTLEYQPINYPRSTEE